MRSKSSPIGGKRKATPRKLPCNWVERQTKGNSAEKGNRRRAPLKSCCHNKRHDSFTHLPIQSVRQLHWFRVRLSVREFPPAGKVQRKREWKVGENSAVAIVTLGAFWFVYLSFNNTKCPFGSIPFPNIFDNFLRQQRRQWLTFVCHHFHYYFHFFTSHCLGFSFSFFSPQTCLPRCYLLGVMIFLSSA